MSTPEGRDPMDETNAVTVDVLPAPDEFRGYAGVASQPVSAAQARTLMEEFTEQEHDVLPTGEVYVPQIHYRRRLNLVFLPAGWALVPRGPYVQFDAADDRPATLCREYALVANGRFISEATGETEYHPSNARMTYASAAEAVKSNALMRCCKDLGMGSECWDKRWCERFIKENCVAVWRRNSRKRKPEWRLKTAQPFHDEEGPANGPSNGKVAVPDKPAPAEHASSRPSPRAVKEGMPACPRCVKNADVIVSRKPENGSHYCFKCQRPFDVPKNPEDAPWTGQ